VQSVHISVLLTKPFIRTYETFTAHRSEPHQATSEPSSIVTYAAL